jgi:hypothetical protein
LVLAGIFIFALGLVSIPGKGTAADKNRFAVPTTSYAIWYNEIMIGLPK